MANNLILRCKFDGQTFDLDTFEDIPFRVDVSAIQQNQIGSVFGIASQVISLPGSKNNNTFFQAAFNVNSPFARGFNQSIDCQVLQSGAEVFKGNLVLNEVVTDGASNTNYSVSIVNQSVDFANLIRDQYISQLDFSDYNHAYTTTNITASWETSSFFGGDVYYPLVDYGLDGTDPNIKSLEFGGTVGKVDNSVTPLRVEQFKPAIRVKTIVDKIFESVGYEYSSSFFDSSEFQDIYFLTTPNDKLGIVSKQAQDAGFSATKSTQQGFTGTTQAKLAFGTDIYDPINQWDTSTSTFTVFNAGTYAFQSSLRFFKTLSNEQDADFEFQLIKNGTILLASYANSVKGMITGRLDFSTAGFLLNSGDTIELFLSWNGRTTELSPTTLNILASGSTFGTIYAPAAIVGGNVDLSAQFDPKMKSLDFLKGIIEKFNLVIEPKVNQTNTLIVEPFDIWADGGQVKDWSFKYDRATKISVKHPIVSQPLKLVFNDSFDADPLNEYSKNNFDFENPFGTATYVANSDIPKGERKVGGFFSPLPTKGIVGAPSVILPHLYRQDGPVKKSFKFKPRIGYRIDNNTAIGPGTGVYFIYNNDTLTSEPFNSYSTISSIQSYPAGSSKSLHFDGGAWYPFHQNQVSGFTPNGAFSTYWGRYINELYDDESRILTLNMTFNPSELKNIQLNDKIFIDNAYYRINKISGFNITDTDSVQVELLKAPIRKFKYPRTKIRIGDVSVALGVESENDFLPQGTVVVTDENNVVVTDSNILQSFAVNTGLRFISGSVYWKTDYNTYLDVNAEQNIRGSVTIDPSAGAVIGAADNSTIGQGVDKAIVIGTSLDIQRNVKNSYIGGDNITIISGSENVAVFSSVDSVVGGNSRDVTLISTSGSLVNGTLNTIIGSQDSKVFNNTKQTTLIGGKTIFMDGSLNTFDRHTHIGGDNVQYYLTSSSEQFVNSVGLGQLPNHPVAIGVDKANKVLVGDSIYSGGVWLKVENGVATAGGVESLVGNTDTFLSNYTWSGSNGNYTVILPDASVNEGRWLQFMTDGTFNGSTNLNLTPSGSQTINGSPEFGINQDFKGASVISNGSNWVVVGGA
jgi:hypothetical protein